MGLLLVCALIAIGLFWGFLTLVGKEDRAKAKIPLANLLIQANPQKIRDTIILQMLNRGMVLIEDSPMRLVFEKVGSEKDSLVASMLAGEYAAKSRQRYTFIFVAMTEGVAVTANADLWTQYGHGHPSVSRINGTFLMRWLNELNNACSR